MAALSVVGVSRGVEQFDDLLAWFHGAGGFAWPVVEFLGDRVEVALRVDGWAGAFGEALAQEPVGVLVGAALPRGVQVADVDGHVRRGAGPFVRGGFLSLVPGRRIAQEFGRRGHFVDDVPLDVFGVVPVGQVRQDREPGGALDERADRAFVAAAGDEIALPAARGRPVLDLRGRSEIMTTGSRKRGLRPWPPWGLRAVRPCLTARFGSCLSPPPACRQMAWRMVSTLACMSPLSGNIAFGLPDIRSGLQCLRNPAGIPARNGVPSAALRGLGRLGRLAAFCRARQGSQSPVPGFPLRSASRPTVPGPRPGGRAMARIESPGRGRSATGMRSS